MTDITDIIETAKKRGEPVLEKLLPVIYGELKRMASNKLAKEYKLDSVNTTDLVHETYLRLVPKQSEREQWENRAHFFSAAAEAMRRILIERARKNNSVKHGKSFRQLHLDLAGVSEGEAKSDVDLEAIDLCLKKFEIEYPEEAELVKLRFFVGMTMMQASEAMNISRRTAQRYWRFAKARLFSLLNAKP